MYFDRAVELILPTAWVLALRVYYMAFDLNYNIVDLLTLHVCCDIITIKIFYDGG